MHVAAIGIRVKDATVAFDRAVANGAMPKTKPFVDAATGVATSEVVLYPAARCCASSRGSGSTSCPSCRATRRRAAPKDGIGLGKYGIERIDHVVGNVPDLLKTVDYVMNATGFHEFAEFTAEDVGTVDSGLNSMVMASNNERVLLPVNEPTTGGKRKSQILTYIEQHGGPGVQHIALKTDDVFATVAAMRAACEAYGGFELMDRPRDQYYDKLRGRIGAAYITEAEVAQCRELGILADRDDQGVLLQIFTKPIGDRSTLLSRSSSASAAPRTRRPTRRSRRSPAAAASGRAISTSSSAPSRSTRRGPASTNWKRRRSSERRHRGLDPRGCARASGRDTDVVRGDACMVFNRAWVNE